MDEGEADMHLAHEDTLIAWSQERGAQVQGAVDTTLFSVDAGDEGERLELVAGGCELWVRSRGPFTLLATMSSVVAAEKYMFYTRAGHRRIALGFPRWSYLRVGDRVAAGVTITWGDTTTTMSWSEPQGLETITFFYPKASAAVTLSHLVQMPVVDLIAAIESPAEGTAFGNLVQAL
ncbi:hypothetical protein [Frigoribacterium sp. VKM Ac-2836]|uniref:hypothetical protein n=1 Tax=Frigoribacterium sp. VKM Ac-2836 TaxID=2739014 RepID=UPI001566119C|nr:hypothetical protein [Frigoribacterium sp. VKM Ac-2836]NRD27941.1 hypothetical protein [Frigoribacterium sp. VKM Ac-2836]